jgi:hypothetical protein
MLRKEKIISHPTEGFAKIKSRGSRNKINKIPSQHPHVPEIKKRFQGSICLSQFSLPMLMAEDSLFSLCCWHVKFGNRVNFQIFPVDIIKNEFKGFPSLSHEKGNPNMV